MINKIPVLNVPVGQRNRSILPWYLKSNLVERVRRCERGAFEQSTWRQSQVVGKPHCRATQLPAPVPGTLVFPPFLVFLLAPEIMQPEEEHRHSLAAISKFQIDSLYESGAEPEKIERS